MVILFLDASGIFKIVSHEYILLLYWGGKFISKSKIKDNSSDDNLGLWQAPDL